MYDMLGNERYEAKHPRRESLKLPDLVVDAALAQACVGRVTDVLASAEDTDEDTAGGNTGGSSRRPSDFFRPCNTAPFNSGRIFLDFESKDGERRPATFEGKPKGALFKNTDASSFGTIALGMGGVGKTCTLRALAADDAVKRRFEGGVYFLTLGAQARTKDVILRLAGSVEASGGRAEASQIRRVSSLDSAIRKAQA